ncbi:hypothetical protein KL930_000669 [Ogataea haglerorum]|uniref:thioredoxin-dependent peroxiredoxin n=1 Tax=Ogataea haglerorum TaxID=1937702 RepID=A0AAN6DAC5_9ASCO|nr:uncharacterized protein KL911_003352 [Ogataea haglerorum]KAG7699982.1 hypothetical protein KL915_000671 [Ogataea haglerorum]KAG7701640.1 hypothetical protein KL951_000096 [Ogataea haglerorum]KAG7711454.1 hypothetical protein KL914_000096 [Ogataea haglerorum]KAG7712225.1 hypothetical protein KL950_000096 [Ogataea haglerorum]KAG7722276.1 hypothetical protein KL913_000096 [Ogataea haglerorum]
MVRRSARLREQEAQEAVPEPKKQKTETKEPVAAQFSEDQKPAEKKNNDKVESTNTLQEGDALPDDLELENQDGEKVAIAQYAKDAKVLVVFLYPKASTPGCTRQAIGFRDKAEELIKLGATVVGLSSDSPKAQTTFKTKQQLPYDLWCDPSKQLIGLLGAKKHPNGIVRSDFIFQDAILKVKRVGISPEKSFNGAIELVKGLSE